MMSNRVDWLDIPEPLRDAILTAVRKITYDLATDQSDYDRVDVLWDIFSTIHPVGEVCRDVRDHQREALSNAARDCGQSEKDFRPVARLDPFGPRGCMVGDDE